MYRGRNPCGCCWKYVIAIGAMLMSIGSLGIFIFIFIFSKYSNYASALDRAIVGFGATITVIGIFIIIIGKRNKRKIK